MRHLSNLLRLPASGWHAGLFAVLVVLIATVAATQGTGPNKFTVKPLPLDRSYEWIDVSQPQPPSFWRANVPDQSDHA
jgi:hypothetical protein